MTTTGKGSRPASALKTLLTGAAMTAALGFAMNAQAGAPSCTAENWSDFSAAGATGTQGADNRRYGGPCGMRTQAGEFVTSAHPSDESTYHVRFYAFLNNAEDGATIFETDAYEVIYDSGELLLMAADSGGPDAGSMSLPVDSGWYSVHVSWDANSGDIDFMVANRDGEASDSLNLDLSALRINEAHLGNMNATGGAIDFDDFVSTRITPPDRLMVGDANDDSQINISDVVADLSEINEVAFALGQPDCNEDGSINISDAVCILSIINQ